MKNSIPALIIAIAFVAGVALAASAYQNRNAAEDVIRVTGLGKSDFESDLIVWNGSFQRQEFNLEEAYSLLKMDQETVRKYLRAEGIHDTELVFSAVDISKNFDYYYDENGNRRSEFKGFVLNQSVNIESKAVERVEKVSRSVTELIDKGVEFYSRAPQYYYTRLSELKIEMIKAATADARLRAEQIASKANAKLGTLKEANMGVFQIIGQNSNEDYSWGGTFNTTDKMKTATITMRLEFGID